MALRGYRPSRWSKFIPDSGVMALIDVLVRAERAWVNVLVRRPLDASARQYIPNGGRECADPLGVATLYRHEGDALGADAADRHRHLTAHAINRLVAGDLEV